jgi:two-component system, OmpR family, response regulator CpxR
VRCEAVKDVMRPKKTILCVDDNEQGLAVRKFLLETRGYRVISAVSAHDAIELLRNGGIDLVLGDLIMPQMDGNEMVQRMKEIAPEVPMVLLSGTVKAFDRASHADAFLPKGACSPVELLERIRVMIARKRGPKKVIARPAFETYTGAFAGEATPSGGFVGTAGSYNY